MKKTIVTIALSVGITFMALGQPIGAHHDPSHEPPPCPDATPTATVTRTPTATNTSAIQPEPGFGTQTTKTPPTR